MSGRPERVADRQERTDSPAQEERRAGDITGAPALVIAAGVGLAILVWTVLLLALPEAHVAVVAPRAQASVQAVGGLARLFAALVLFMFPPARGRQRLHWIAAGLVIVGVSDLAFGYLQALLNVTPSPKSAMYTSLVVRTLAAALFVVGLLPRRQPPAFTWKIMLACLAIQGAASYAVAQSASHLPPLTDVRDFQGAVAGSHAILAGLTGWHWVLSAIPLCLVALATIAAVRYTRQGMLGGWLLVAMVLWTGSQLHNLLWPSLYSPVLTTADLLRLAFGVVVAVGAVLELRSITERRTTKLAIEEEQSKRLIELGVMKANFTAMVAHELGSPLAAIRMFTDMLAMDELSTVERAQALEGIQKEIDTLNTLVRDVNTAATVERDDFSVRPRPVSLGGLLVETALFAKSISGDHRFKGPIAVNEMVWADPDRIGQVLRNLVSNAGKYAPPGTPIELRTRRVGHRVRIEVADHGAGIHPDDVARIFEKFGRGRSESGQKIAGVGLGLYLSRRIVQAHGSDLTVASRIEGGSVFGFELEVVL